MARIIVVDDLPLAIQVIRHHLEPRGHQVLGAGDWIEFVGIVAEQQAPVVLLDVHLPGVRGDSLVGDVRKVLSPRTEVLLYSAVPEPELEVLARESRASGYIHKNWTRARMVDVIERALGNAGSFEAPALEPLVPVERKRQDTLLPWQAPRDEDFWLPRIMIVEDMELRRQFLLRWFGQRGFLDIQEARDGRQALDKLKQTPTLELPQLLLSDLEMPVMDGLLLADALAGEPHLKQIEVLLYSSTDARSRVADAPDAATARRLKDVVVFDKLERHVSQRVKSIATRRRLDRARKELQPEF